jgi:acetyl esterase/lipase
MADRPLLFRVSGMESVPVRRGVVYRTGAGGPLTIDVYSPPGTTAASRLPVVVFVIGYSDVGAVQRLGCPFKEVESYVNWAQLIAASGMVAILYQNEEPGADVRTVLDYLYQHADELRVDATRIGVWASSGNVPVALSTLLRDASPAVKCAALCYGLMLEVGGQRYVADAQKLFGFVNATEGKSIADLVPDLPILLVRAGKDEIPHLNDTIDAFFAAALARNLPITLVNYADAPHAFDLTLDTPRTHDVVRRLVTFLRFNLLDAAD